MTFLERFARLEHSVRPWISLLPPALAARTFSRGRIWFSHRLESETPPPYTIRTEPVHAWNLTFRLPLWNAAGMFKDGNGYSVMAAQGAGAYVAGTTTAIPRKGNIREGIKWPAVPYARSGSASNWMGLPNPGHTAVATRLSRLPRETGVPIGASVSADPGVGTDEALRGLLAGLNAYSLAMVDYIELNESCPNVPGANHGNLDDALIQRLEIISEKFLQRRHRALPVVVKFSNDLLSSQLSTLITTLIDMQYDGIILGNTSTQYDYHRQAIAQADKKLYDMFTTAFGGGLSGAVLKAPSLSLATQAQNILSTMSPRREFHVIRCGGIQSSADVVASMKQGVTLHQWYTGYFEAFATQGHAVYQRFSESMTDFLMESSRTDTLS